VIVSHILFRLMSFPGPYSNPSKSFQRFPLSQPLPGQVHASVIRLTLPVATLASPRHTLPPHLHDLSPALHMHKPLSRSPTATSKQSASWTTTLPHAVTPC